MPERLSEEQIEQLLEDQMFREVRAEAVGDDPAFVAAHVTTKLAQALRQVRGALEHANHMRAVYDAENQESLRLLRLAEEERNAVREQVRRLREAAQAVLDADSRKPAQVWEAFDNLRAALAASVEDPALGGEQEEAK